MIELHGTKMPYWYNHEWHTLKQSSKWRLNVSDETDRVLRQSPVFSSEELRGFYYMECLHFSPLLSSFQTRRQSCVWNAVGLNVQRCRPHCSCGKQQLKSSPQNFSSGINNRSFDIPEAQNVPEHGLSSFIQPRLNFWRFSLSHLVGILQGLSSIIWLLE